MKTWQVAQATLMVSGLGLVLVGCGGHSAPAAISAIKVCDGHITSVGAKSVEFLTGATKFAPKPGDSSEASYPKAASALVDGYVETGNSDSVPKPACSIADLKGGSPELSVGFRTETGGASGGPVSDTLKKYDVGRGAFIGSGRSYLYFACVSSKFHGSTKSSPAIVVGELTNNAQGQGRYKPKGDAEKVSEANLAVLNSLSLSMAKELGCADAGGLSSD
ncbi:hypothetical protein [Streptomyces fuscigenes]|uniref:hypothetical protein n=1 Tax=Streptomyces fuscigenes TaxID=1528880 RepID=UPI001F3A5AEE|nr:hypothetical protein [Streptomyces fuscigenes]MCF3961720.1 hypothetical protein [Streptomyces fuscigenes]